VKTIYPYRGSVGAAEALREAGFLRTRKATGFRAGVLGVQLLPEGRALLNTQQADRARQTASAMWAAMSDEERRRRSDLTQETSTAYWSREGSREQHSDKMREVLTQRWAAMTPDEREAHSQKMRRVWELKTPEQKEAHGKHTSEKNIRFWASLSDVEREHLKIAIGAGQQRQWANLSEEERQQARERHRVVMLAVWASLSDIEREAWAATGTKNLKRVDWASLSEEESLARRQVHGERTKAMWACFTDDERDRLCRIWSEQLKKRWAEGSPEDVAKMLATAHQNSQQAMRKNNLKSPNKAETSVRDFAIPGLEMTLSDPEARVLLRHPDGRKWRKNPDFAFEWRGARSDGSPRLVVEVMGFGKWHSKDEVQHLVDEYAVKGTVCLVVDARDLQKHPAEVRTRIEAAIAALGPVQPRPVPGLCSGMVQSWIQSEKRINPN